MTSREPSAPPQNLDAEESVLGAMMISKRAIENVADVLVPADFYRGSHGVIFQVALDLAEKGEVDAILLTEELSQRGELDKVGGRARIHEIASLTPTASNVAHYAQIVKDTRAQRDLIRAGGEISQLGWRGGPVDEARALAEDILTNAVTENVGGEFQSLTSGMTELIDEIRTAFKTGEYITGLKTGFAGLDKLTTGLHPGQLVVIAARPAMGKSVLAQNIAENVAEAGGSSAIFSLEMQRREHQLRSLARQGSIPLDRLRTGALAEEDVPKMKPAIDRIEGWKFFVEDDGAITPPELRARARRLQRTEGLDLLVVDYLQLMSSGKQTDNRSLEIAQITRSLKMLARELGIPVIAVSQLNRGVEGRADNKRPGLADLRESGAIEQDADLIVFIYRDDYYKPDSEAKGVAELIVAKNRMGSIDTVKLSFVGRYQTFKTLGGVS